MLLDLLVNFSCSSCIFQSNIAAHSNDNEIKCCNIIRGFVDNVNYDQIYIKILWLWKVFSDGEQNKLSVPIQ